MKARIRKAAAALLEAECEYLLAHGWVRDTERTVVNVGGWIDPEKWTVRRRVLNHGHAVNAQKQRDRYAAMAALGSSPVDEDAAEIAETGEQEDV